MRDRRAVADALTRQGFVVHDPGTGSLLSATASAGAIEQAFHVTISDYRDAAGNVFAASDVEPTLPAAVAARTDAVIGLDDLPAARPKSIQAPPPLSAGGDVRDAPTGCQAARNDAGGATGPFTPNELATAYGFDPLYAANYKGQGETAALFETDDYYDTDIATWQSCFGITTPVNRELVDETTHTPSLGCG